MSKTSNNLILGAIAGDIIGSVFVSNVLKILPKKLIDIVEAFINKDFPC